MTKILSALAFFFCVAGTNCAFATETLQSGPCLSAVCLGQPFSEIVDRQWVTDDTSWWMAWKSADLAAIPIAEPVRSELNESKVANLQAQGATIRNRHGVELMQLAKFCGAYWFDLSTLDEHGWTMNIRVLPMVSSNGSVVLRVVQVTKQIHQPLITQEQIDQRAKNFNDHFAVYQKDWKHYDAFISGGSNATVFIGYHVNWDDQFAAANNGLRKQLGCQQASAVF